MSEKNIPRIPFASEKLMSKWIMQRFMAVPVWDMSAEEFDVHFKARLERLSRSVNLRRDGESNE